MRKETGMSDGPNIATYRVIDGIAVLKIDSPPVNALGHAVRVALCEGVLRALADDGAKALVLICGGRTFFAGADVTEIGKPILKPWLADVMAQFEASSKPIVAAMHGTALGGGLELALACHYRVVVPTAVVGLPEVALGLIPGAGGTQRTPRLVGVATAVEMIGLGQHVAAARALSTGLIDAILDEGELEPQAIAFARRIVDENVPLRRVRDLEPDLGIDQAREVFARFQAENPALFRGVKAADGALRAIEAAVSLPFEDGLEQERAISRELTASPESAAQRHLFFAERAAAKLPGHEKAKAPAAPAVTIIGDWEHSGQLREAGVNIVGRGEFAQAAIAVGEGAAAPAAAGAQVGISVSRGVAEIVVDAACPLEAALAAQAVARKAGWLTIFVAPSPKLVIRRLSDRLQAAISATVEDGVPLVDIRATGQAFGFDAALLPDIDRQGLVDEELERRLVYPVLAEAMAILDEGVAKRSSDIDFAMVRAGLWPLWRGGPAYLAGLIGREAVYAWLGCAASEEQAGG
jgi:enoyl-CoA hydratase/carnithine racemase